MRVVHGAVSIVIAAAVPAAVYLTGNIVGLEFILWVRS